MTATERPQPDEGVSFRLEGKRALVTGASRGIGAACAVGLARAGVREVVLVARTLEDLERVAEDVRAAGARALVTPCDVTATSAVEAAFRGLPALDVVVNCAGANAPGRFVDVDEATFDALWALNVRSSFFVAQHAVRGMLEAGRPGVVINVTSQLGHVGSPDARTVYCTTKHAVEGLTKAMALELAPHGVRVVSIAPTFIYTELTAPFFADEDFRRSVERRIPLGRIGDVGDVVGAVIFAASSAASLVTGSSVLVDGGWTAQ